MAHSNAASTLVVDAEIKVYRAQEALRMAIEAAPAVYVARSALARLAPGAPPRCRLEAQEALVDARREAFETDGVVRLHRQRLAAASAELEATYSERLSGSGEYAIVVGDEGDEE